LGYSPAQLGGSISAHYLGAADSHLNCGPHDKTALLDCECGCPGCWTLMAHVTKTSDMVIWTAFEQVHRDWQYDDFSLTFDRDQYESALAELGEVE